MITKQDEFIPEERLDIAAASSPASTNPENPIGSPITIKRGNNKSASLMIVEPVGIKSGFLVKNPL